MKSINIKNEVSKFLFDKFKKHIGKYMFFEYEIYGKRERVYFYIRDVKWINGEGKIKLDRVMEDKKIIKEREILIRNLRDDTWNILNKNEFKKMLVIDKLR